jgi:aminopeptidase N
MDLIYFCTQSGLIMRTLERLPAFVMLICLPFFSHGQMDLGKAVEEKKLRVGAAGFAEFSSIRTHEYDLKYHRLEWKVDPVVKYISGAVTSYFKTCVVGFDTIYFDLSDSMAVDSIQYHGNAATFQHLAGDRIWIALPAEIPVNSLDSVTVWYHGRPAATGFGSFVQSEHQGTPMIWTLSEPYGAKDWWPCKNGITDKVDSIDVFVTAPVGNRVAGNGVLISVVPGPGVNTHHWKHRHPIATYLIAFAVTNYAAYSDWVPYGGDTLEVLNYVFPEDSGSFAQLTRDIIPVVQLFDSLWGIYPYQDEKYGHYQSGWRGGMEHQTMSMVHNGNFDLLAHELAHQWFGDKVTCGSWQDIWLNESWATYIESTIIV